MTTTLQQKSGADATTAGSSRSHLLADRLEAGAQALAAFASTLSDADWQTRVPHDGRTFGVIVHHVASVYPVEVHLAQVLASGQPITDVVWDTVHTMNAAHAAEHRDVTRQAAIDLLRANSQAAAAAVRAMTDAELDAAAPASLYDDAPVTCQFMLEDHAVRHSYHHLAVMQRTLKAAVR